MKHSEFVEKLLLRYPKLQDTRFQLQDIRDNLETVSEFVLDDLWRAFNSNYDRDTAPRWASINLSAQKAGIYFGSAKSIKFWVYVCQYCGSYFGGHHGPVDGPKCTGCKQFKPASILVLDRDDNPFNLNASKFDAKAGNTATIPPIEPHRLSIDWPKWSRDHEPEMILAAKKPAKINAIPVGSTLPHFEDQIPF